MTEAAVGDDSVSNSDWASGPPYVMKLASWYSSTLRSYSSTCPVAME
jgi:hypothetical protein